MTPLLPWTDADPVTSSLYAALHCQIEYIRDLEDDLRTSHRTIAELEARLEDAERRVDLALVLRSPPRTRFPEPWHPATDDGRFAVDLQPPSLEDLAVRVVFREELLARAQEDDIKYVIEALGRIAGQEAAGEIYKQWSDGRFRYQGGRS